MIVAWVVGNQELPGAALEAVFTLTVPTWYYYGCTYSDHIYMAFNHYGYTYQGGPGAALEAQP